MANVTFCEGKIVRSTKQIEALGLRLGIITDVHDNNNGDIVSIDILTIKERVLIPFIPFIKEIDLYKVGTLWLESKAKGAHNKNLILEVLGSGMLPKMKELAERLSHEFNTGVHIRLERECMEYVPCLDPSW